MKPKLPKTFRAIVREEVGRAVEPFRVGGYDPSYSVLTINFAPGSEPAALSIPYQRWANRAEISVPLKVVRE